jgi:hypothetical protein
MRAVVVVTLVAGSLLSACTGESPAAAPTVPASGHPFVACLRDQGIDVADPEPGDRSGRGVLRRELDVNHRGDDPAFQAALDRCAGLLPPLPPPDVDEAVLAGLRAFARCMRDNGRPDFPDPDPVTGRLVEVPTDPGPVVSVRRYEQRVIVVEDRATRAALARCRTLIPPADDPDSGEVPAPVG